MADSQIDGAVDVDIAIGNQGSIGNGNNFGAGNGNIASHILDAGEINDAVV